MKSYDAIVIGGGVIGTSVAYYLSKKGVKVALIERDDIGAGAAGRSLGNIKISDKRPGVETKIAYESQLLFKELANEISYNFDYAQRGSLYIIENEEELKVAKDYVKRQVEDGYPMRIMDKSEILNNEPYLAKDIIGAIETDCDASVNPMALAFGLSLEAKKNGVDIFEYTSVKDIRLNNKRVVKTVITDEEKLITKYAINCAGVWAPEIGNIVGINIPIIPEQGQTLVSEKTFQVGKRNIVEFSRLMHKFGYKNYKRKVSTELERLRIGFVFQVTKANNFLIGASNAFVGFDNHASIEVMRGLAKRAIRFFPIIKDINIIRAYAGLRPYVQDNMPIISKVEEIPGFYIAAGHGDKGICLSLFTGKLISQMITGEETIIPTDFLSIQRFEKSKTENHY